MFAETTRDDTYALYRLRLEALLDIPREYPDQNIQDSVVAGLSPICVTKLCELGKISPEERNQIIALNTLKDRLARHQRLTVDESGRLFRVVHIIATAEVMFGSDEKAKRWLTKPKIHFLGQSPLAMLDTAEGTSRVEEMLIQISEGLSC